MTENTFKLKAPTVQAIEVTNLLSQAPDVANLTGSQAYQVDIAKAVATFTIDGREPLAVKAGQVVFVLNGTVSAQDSSEFYASYEKA